MLLFKTCLSIKYEKRRQYKKNKLTIIAPTWNDEFEFPGGSDSALDTQDYIEYIIKKHETLATIPLIHVYINRKLIAG